MTLCELQVKLRDALTTRAIPGCFCSGLSLRRDAILSVLTMPYLEADVSICAIIEVSVRRASVGGTDYPFTSVRIYYGRRYIGWRMTIYQMQPINSVSRLRRASISARAPAATLWFIVDKFCRKLIESKWSSGVSRLARYVMGHSVMWQASLHHIVTSAT